MERICPKIKIINHFDYLINRIDVDINSSLEWFNDKQHIIGSYIIFDDVIFELNNNPR